MEAFYFSVCFMLTLDIRPGVQCLVCFMLTLDIRPRGSMILSYVDNNNQGACLFILFVSYDIHRYGQLNILDLCKMKKFLCILNVKKVHIFNMQLDTKLTHV